MHHSTLIVFLSAVGLSLAAEEVQQVNNQEQQVNNQEQQQHGFVSKPPKRFSFKRPLSPGFGQQTGSFGGNQEQGLGRRPPPGVEQQFNDFNENQGQEFGRPHGSGRPPKYGFGKPPPLSDFGEQQEQSGSSHEKPVDEPTKQQDDVEVTETKVEQENETEQGTTFEDVETKLEKEETEDTEKEEDSENEVDEEE